MVGKERKVDADGVMRFILIGVIINFHGVLNVRQEAITRWNFGVTEHCLYEGHEYLHVVELETFAQV